MGDINSTGNVTIWDELSENYAQVDDDLDLHTKAKLWDGTDEVTVTDNKLDVNAITTPPKYRLQTETDLVDIDFTNDDWHTIFDLTDEGTPYYLHIEFYDGNFEIRVTMDGVVSFQMDNTEMGTHDLNDGNQVRYQHNAPYRRSNDLVSWHFPDGLTFDSTFKVEVRRRSGSGHGFDNGLLLWGVKF